MKIIRLKKGFLRIFFLKKIIKRGKYPRFSHRCAADETVGFLADFSLVLWKKNNKNITQLKKNSWVICCENRLIAFVWPRGEHPAGYGNSPREEKGLPCSPRSRLSILTRPVDARIQSGYRRRLKLSYDSVGTQSAVLLHLSPKFVIRNRNVLDKSRLLYLRIQILLERSLWSTATQ